MKINNLKEIVDHTDIYLIDQIIKERYLNSEIILDAGCGSGRNLHWFYNNGFVIYGIDKSESNIENVKKKYSNQVKNFSFSKVEELAFENDYFNHIICNAVLHFAVDESHFLSMFSELMRVLKSKGSLFIRVASDIGIKDKIIPVSEGVYKLPDGTTRYLFTKSLFSKLEKLHNFTLLEPLKTVNVNDLRCMTTLVIQKQ
ncbi:MAG: class I SAM-dependent methyltransferase [Bacteroidetes bacterium]|nr:class I SAM-dependent methyltransferase [Bacteroidota bacterium]